MAGEINVIGKIIPKNDAFTGIVDSDQVLSKGVEGNLIIFGSSGQVLQDSGVAPYTDAMARQAISESIVGIAYNNTTGVFSLTAGYVIPTTTEESNWNSAYGWGDHSTEGYLKTFTETDPVAMQYLNQSVKTDSNPTFANLNIGTNLSPKLLTVFNSYNSSGDNGILVEDVTGYGVYVRSTSIDAVTIGETLSFDGDLYLNYASSGAVRIGTGGLIVSGEGSFTSFTADTLSATRFDVSSTVITEDLVMPDTYTKIVVYCDSTENSFTVTLPDPQNIQDRIYFFKKIDSSSNTVAINPYGSETIDGENEYLLELQGEFVLLHLYYDSFSEAYTWNVLGE